MIARSTLAGISYDIGAEGWAVRLPDTAELATELGLTVEKPTIAPSWVYFDDACFAMPDNAILGIPANLQLRMLVDLKMLFGEVGKDIKKVHLIG